MTQEHTLPFGWQRPTRDAQLDLFPQERDEALAMARVSLDELARWRERGWISFDPADLDTMHTPLLNETAFVRNLARSGLSDHQITGLLAELEPPYSYEPARCAYSFAFGWVQVPPVPEKIEIDDFVREALPGWITDSAALGQFDLLEELKVDIILALAEARVRQAAGHGEIEDE